MFVTRGRFDRMEAEARALSAMAQALAEQLHTAATERDNARGMVEKLNGTLADQQRRMGIKITELNETIEDRDQQIRHAYRQINKRGERGRFVAKGQVA